MPITLTPHYDPDPPLGCIVNGWRGISGINVRVIVSLSWDDGVDTGSVTVDNVFSAGDRLASGGAVDLIGGEFMIKTQCCRPCDPQELVSRYATFFDASGWDDAGTPTGVTVSIGDLEYSNGVTRPTFDDPSGVLELGFIDLDREGASNDMQGDVDGAIGALGVLAVTVPDMCDLMQNGGTVSNTFDATNTNITGSVEVSVEFYT